MINAYVRRVVVSQLFDLILIIIIIIMPGRFTINVKYYAIYL